jgi:hypothetical protein
MQIKNNEMKKQRKMKSAALCVCCVTGLKNTCGIDKHRSGVWDFEYVTLKSIR